ncbi:uncharacterized protein LOC101237700 [Hydra vulgaris]|uniref:uncharacterized protein LOC101237700 n=1 Tax=Hydra vulgaris TaxID=6087 RepID=UPI0002B44E3F|nr:uncharacterized protein LOC101237700 [Hydra vulgaris]
MFPYGRATVLRQSCDCRTTILDIWKPTFSKKNYTDDGYFRVASVATGKVSFTKISLWMPFVNPSSMFSLTVYKEIESKVELPAPFRSRQCVMTTVPESTEFNWRLGVKTNEIPRYIIVRFQIGKSGNQQQNPSIFDHCNLKNMYVMLNQEKHPIRDYNLSFPNQEIIKAYRDTALFRKNIYGMDEIVAQSNINYSDYSDLYPIKVFDVSKQSERLKITVVDIQVIASFSINVLANTTGYAVIISDRFGRLQSNRNRFSFEY